MLTEHKVKMDESTQKNGKGQVAGFPTESLTATGKDEDGPCRVTILIVHMNGKALVFTYWFNTPAGDKYEDEIDAIQSSLKAAS
jgi:hypothetical protein